MDSLFLFSCILNFKQPAFGPSTMIGKNQIAQVLLYRFEYPGENPNRVIQQTRISGIMNIRFDNSCIDTDLASLFDSILLCPSEQFPVDLLPGFSRYRLDILCESRALKGLVRYSYSHKVGKGYGIGNVESKLLIAEVEHLLYQSGSKHLLGAHSQGTDSFARPATGKILKHEIDYGRVVVENSADRLEFFCPRVIDSWSHNRNLFFYILQNFF